VVTRLEFGLLGPLLVDRGGDRVPIPAGRQRALLAVLLLNAGQLVSAGDLIEALWGLDPPTSARASLQNYVRRLRKALGDGDHSRIRTQPRGYLISADASELDVARFEVLLRAARAAAKGGSWDQASAAAHEAMSLWRGEPLADVESEMLALREVPRLSEMRLQALEVGLEADLHLGRHADVILELRRLAGAYPLREHLHALLMLALYQCGRQAEALAVYRDARKVLVNELGTEPGAELHQLHQRMLNAEPIVAVAESAPQAGHPVRVVPRELPSAVRYFTGRERELSLLTTLLERGIDEAPGTVVISAIGGTAGVGKTALAVYWAHQAAERFPDGQLYVNLRGYDPRLPMQASDALAGFLRTLGVPTREIPADADERAAYYRSVLAGRQMLVVLDNARSEEQVRPLLPATVGCVALVTSRDSLAGLVAREGACRIELDLLPLKDATGLLRALISEQAAADPAATQAMAAQCSRLPLALRVAAERAAARPGASLADLVAELADERRRLDMLDTGRDPRTAVRTVFSWSYRHLDPGAAHAFRLISLHPGSDLDCYAAAALTGTTVTQARHLLEQLARAYLIQPSGPARYGLHDLLRAYARELCADHDAEDERRAALTRLFDYYLHTAAVAVDTLYPADQHRRPRIPRPATPVPPVTSLAAAQAWLDAELANLAAVAAHTASYGWPRHTTRLGISLFRYLDTGGHIAEALAIHACARAAARHLGDSAAEAEALISLGTVELRQGQYQKTVGLLRRALALCRATGDRSGEARALHNLGVIALQHGRWTQANGHFERAVALYREVGDRYGEARALGNLDIVAIQQGRYQQAAEHTRQALALSRETGDRSGEAYGLNNLGIIEQRQGCYESATGYHRQALTLFRETGDRSGEAYALADLGDVDMRQGRYQQAVTHHRRSLELFRETGDPAGQVKALNGLGEVLFATGRHDDACAQHAIALELASQMGDKYEQARAHDGLGHAYQSLGDRARARSQWEKALTIYARLGTPEADQLRARLAEGRTSPVESLT
jgi:DNA-binding SARP family transcriptional activator/Tfp pilus assembly protein PilF